MNQKVYKGGSTADGSGGRPFQPPHQIVCFMKLYYSLCPMHLWSLSKDTRHIQCLKQLQG